MLAVPEVPALVLATPIKKKTIQVELRIQKNCHCEIISLPARIPLGDPNEDGSRERTESAENEIPADPPNPPAAPEVEEGYTEDFRSDFIEDPPARGS